MNDVSSSEKKVNRKTDKQVVCYWLCYYAYLPYIRGFTTYRHLCRYCGCERGVGLLHSYILTNITTLYTELCCYWWGRALTLLHSFNLTCLIYEALRHSDAHAVTWGGLLRSYISYNLICLIYEAYDLQTLCSY